MNLTEANQYGRVSLAEGMRGWDVIAIQAALNGTAPSPGLAEDGAFGPMTSSAASAVQRKLRVTVDGIVGPQTQGALVSLKCGQAEVGKTPAGLLKGMAFGESGGIITAVTPPYPNGSRDYGAFQQNLSNPSAARLREAFAPGPAASTLAQQLAAAHGRYKGSPFTAGREPEGAWRLAVLSYNWPAAADQIAADKGDTWTYIESGTGAHRKLADPAPWVEAYHIAGVSTGWDWCGFYISSKIVYVNTWTVA